MTEMKRYIIVLYGMGFLLMLTVLVMRWFVGPMQSGGEILALIPYIMVSGAMAFHVFNAQNKRIRALEQRLADQAPGQDKV